MGESVGIYGTPELTLVQKVNRFGQNRDVPLRPEMQIGLQT